MEKKQFTQSQRKFISREKSRLRSGILGEQKIKEEIDKIHILFNRNRNIKK